MAYNAEGHFLNKKVLTFKWKRGKNSLVYLIRILFKIFFRIYEFELL